MTNSDTYPIAHRFLIGYVYARMHSQTGGLLQLWLLKRFATLLSFQPILVGLIFLSRRIWIEGGILVGAGVAVMLFVEIYAAWRLRLPGRGSLRPITRDSLDHFASVADCYIEDNREEMTSESGTRGHLNRGSMASVLDMMSLTLAVEPSAATYRGPVPLRKFVVSPPPCCNMLTTTTGHYFFYVHSLIGNSDANSNGNARRSNSHRKGSADTS